MHYPTGPAAHPSTRADAGIGSSPDEASGTTAARHASPRRRNAERLPRSLLQHPLKRRPRLTREIEAPPVRVLQAVTPRPGAVEPHHERAGHRLFVGKFPFDEPRYLRAPRRITPVV